MTLSSNTGDIRRSITMCTHGTPVLSWVCFASLSIAMCDTLMYEICTYKSQAVAWAQREAFTLVAKHDISRIDLPFGSGRPCWSCVRVLDNIGSHSDAPTSRSQDQHYHVRSCWWRVGGMLSALFTSRASHTMVLSGVKGFFCHQKNWLQTREAAAY